MNISKMGEEAKKQKASSSCGANASIAKASSSPKRASAKLKKENEVLFASAIARVIDQTYLNKEATEEEIRKVCEEAKKYNFRGLCVFPEHTKNAKEALKDTDIRVTTLIDEPTGTSPHEKRMAMVKIAKEDGSDEVDVVMKIDAFKNKKYDEVSEDLKEISKILPTKVIIGSGYLTDEEIKKASEIAKEAGAICVKTATVDDPLDRSELDEKAKHVRIMKESAPGLLVKAAGSIRNMADLEMMIEAGANIIGTSSGVEIVDEATASSSHFADARVVNEAKGTKREEVKDGRIIE